MIETFFTDALGWKMDPLRSHAPLRRKSYI